MDSIREEDIHKIISKIPYKECEDQTFLITGANGFLARYMTDTLMYLKRNGYIRRCTVLALCRSKERGESVFEEWLDDQEFHLLVQPVEKEIVYSGKIDYIVHAAGISQTRMFKEYPVDVINAGMIGSYNLLELAKTKQVKSFLFFSSGAAYGDVDIDELDEITESRLYKLDHLNMKNSYAVGKRAGETLCRAYWQQYRVHTKGVRIAHTYGPGIDLEDGHVYSDFAKSIIERKDIVIRGDGLDSRSFCYVSDAISAFYMILFHGKNGEMYNMANDKMNVTIKELADLLTQKVFLERGLNVIVQTPTNGKVAHKIHMSSAKLESLGWKPEIDVATGFERLVRSEEERHANG